MINKLKKYFENCDYDFVLLFGSYADGTNSSLSDIDIAVYKKNLDLKDLGYDNAMLESLLKLKIDTVILNKLEQKNPLLAFNIIKNHQVLFLKSETNYINFKTRSQLSYLDHKPLLESNMRDLKNRIDTNTFAKRDYA